MVTIETTVGVTGSVCDNTEYLLHINLWIENLHWDPQIKIFGSNTYQ